MSGNLSINPLRLEVFPDELFLEIFQYVDPIDLRNFKGLNKRIDCIIDAVKVNIEVHTQEDCDRNYISSFASTQIIRLEICDYGPSLNFGEMVELRSLILDCSYLFNGRLSQVTSTI